MMGNTLRSTLEHDTAATGMQRIDIQSGPIHTDSIYFFFLSVNIAMEGELASRMARD